MIYLKDKPAGVDKPIQELQKFLYSKLTNWGIEGFGRAEIIDNNPHVFRKKNDYKSGFFINPKTNGRFFFLDNPITDSKQGFSTNRVDLFFLLNVVKIKPLITHRADEEIRVEIVNYLQGKLSDGTVVKSVKGEDALSGFTHDFKSLQPYFLVKFSFELKYRTDINC